jgi:metal transporter CNNM
MASAMSAPRSSLGANGFSRVRMLVVYLFHAFAPAVRAIPLPDAFGGIVHALGEEAHPKNDASLVLYLSVAIALVLAGGVFAGLTIA